jgi:hypothetical protein
MFPPDGSYSFGKRDGPTGPEFLFQIRVREGRVTELVPNGQDNPQLNAIYRMSVTYLLLNGSAGPVEMGRPYLLVMDGV